MLNSSSFFALLLATLLLAGSVFGQEVVFDTTVKRPNMKPSSDKAVKFSMVKFGNRGTEFSGRFTNLLRSPFFCEAIELTKYQEKEIVVVNRQLVSKASDELAKHPNASAETIQFVLQKYGEKQEKHIIEILLRHQIDLADDFDDFKKTVSEGLANSLVKGTLGRKLELTVDQRNDLCKKIKDIRWEYEKKMLDAKKEALKSLAKAISKEKQKETDRFFQPILNASFAGVGDDFLEAPTELSTIEMAIIKRANEQRKRQDKKKHP